ncbi:MAG: ferredoxin-NADP(+) reductase subunit alpha [Candidatus Bathyarchaeota archaeon B26-2]|nr:MAG: ferredoxin-NADP(+) reductase subunit alpha [Candidatus Bathyarchaeota archaeon B26-2]
MSWPWSSEFKILKKEELAPGIKRIVVYAPLIAQKAKVGQFVILRVDEYGERFPLTLVDWNPDEGTITLIFQEVGVSTKKLGALKVGDRILDLVGPLGNPSEIRRYGETVVIGGGVGTALMYPQVLALKDAGNKVTSIIGARTASLLLLVDEISKLSDELYISTDDGSMGIKGFTSDVLKRLLESGRHFDYVFAVGPVLMMRAVAEVTRPYRIKTVVSLNPIMIDGTGMCGGCRVRVGEATKFACVEGPEFDAHQVDFTELIRRLRAYREEETKAVCMLEKKMKERRG